MFTCDANDGTHCRDIKHGDKVTVDIIVSIDERICCPNYDLWVVNEATIVSKLSCLVIQNYEFEIAS
jgi:hypothetical protein